MIDTAIVFGGLAAVFWGLSPVLAKRGFTAGGTPLLAALALVILGTVGLWGLTLVVSGSDAILAAMTPGAAAPFVIGGVVGTAIGRLLNYRGVDAVGASVNSAGVATDPVFATALAVLLLGESVTQTQFLGVGLVALGTAVTVLSGGGNTRGWPWRALVFPFGAAFAYGTGAVVRRFGLQATETSAIQAAALNETAALVALGGYVLTRVDRSALETVSLDSYGYLITAGMANTIGLVSFFIALDSGPVAIGSTLAGMSTLVTVGLSAIVLSEVETVTWTTGVGAAVTVAGALLVV